jgi:hypothetical protein
MTATPPATPPDAPSIEQVTAALESIAADYRFTVSSAARLDLQQAASTPSWLSRQADFRRLHGPDTPLPTLLTLRLGDRRPLGRGPRRARLSVLPRPTGADRPGVVPPPQHFFAIPAESPPMALNPPSRSPERRSDLPETRLNCTTGTPDAWLQR